MDDEPGGLRRSAKTLWATPSLSAASSTQAFFFSKSEAKEER
jgi:hypothetical protein